MTVTNACTFSSESNALRVQGQDIYLASFPNLAFDIFVFSIEFELLKWKQLIIYCLLSRTI